MQISARNQLKGTVKRLNKARSTLRLQELSDGVEIVSIITKQSSEQKLSAGKVVHAVIKASDVMDRHRLEQMD